VQGAQEAGDDDGGRPLNVIVEGAQLVPKAIELFDGVTLQEVLPLEHDLRKVSSFYPRILQPIRKRHNRPTKSIKNPMISEKRSVTMLGYLS
jgi:hypothetical protein